MNFTPQQKLLLDMLADMKWHCPTNELFIKDDRKRFSELRQKGYVFESIPCELHNHNSRVVMRRLVSVSSLQTEAKEVVFVPDHQTEFQASLL